MHDADDGRGEPRVIRDLIAIRDTVASAFSITLTDGDFEYGRDEIVHVFLHETCHAAVSALVPWIHRLDEEEHTALDEILARLVEETIGLSLGLPAHTPEEQVRELVRYPVAISIDQYLHLRNDWRERYWPERDLKGMARCVLDHLRHSRR